MWRFAKLLIVAVLTAAVGIKQIDAQVGSVLSMQPQISDQAVVLVQPLEPRRGHGTGFLISPDGYLLTNAHVVCDSRRIRIRLDDGTEREATVAVLDLDHDLALLKIDALGLPTLSLGYSNALALGERVRVIGFPVGFQQTKVITEGVVSQKGLAMPFTLCRNSNLERSIQLEDLILTTAPTAEGNSGGPMLNAAGEVVGVVNGRIGFGGAAIPVETAKRRLCEWERQGLIPPEVRRAVERPLVLFEDSFSDPLGNWLTWPPPGLPFLFPLFPYVRMGYENGEFSLTVESEHTWMVAPLLQSGLVIDTIVAILRCLLGQGCSLNLKEVLDSKLLFSDFHLQVYVRQIDGPTGSYGIHFRQQSLDSDFYRFAINREGQYQLLKKLGDEWITLVPWTFSAHLGQGASWNRLEVVALGAQIQIYANGWLLETITDASLDKGYLLLFAESGDRPGVHVHFDDFRVLSTTQREGICG
jgi:hypothetical protein